MLNWGDKTICRYENGSVQDKAHNSLLLFLREPENMRTYLTENEIALDERQKAKLMDTVEKLEQDTDYRVGRRFFEMFFSRVPCEENGFKGFDYEKLCAMVLFFAHESSELLKTKLMKLLNYSDMIFYKENGISMSGLKYAHLPYGPVPEHFDMLLGKMEADHIAHIEVIYDNGYEEVDAIAAACGVELVDAIDVKEKDLSDYDLIGFASGASYGKFHQAVLNFVSVNFPQNKKIFYICTNGGNFSFKSIKKIGKDKKATEVGTFDCKGFNNFGPLKWVG